ncbi:diaminopimelate decarboxylase [Clostridium putrefaciens]|uniref:ornithine decarboxylase n=1 Tax=Clostridium putrefaciens TaxID=99675 RepID=A0A381J7B4_9CLOT|nr:hypothetical protein [Clostridium putrefaciens]SUY47140.1 diaminopimelate decarboxylase [Clostridium putrefaciens]
MDTPRYEFSKSEIQRNYKYISKRLPLCKLFYAMKANGNEKVLKVIKETGAGIECASKYEFDCTRRVGANVTNLIFGLPVKTVETILYTYENGCRYYVFDCLNELHKLKKYAPDAKRILRIKISDLVVSSINYGMPLQEIADNLEEIKESIHGISFHISYNNNIRSIQDVGKRIDELMEQLECKGKNYIINIGGGYKPDTDDEFYDVYHNILTNIQEKYGCVFYAEPGNIIVETAGFFYAKVISVKKTENSTIVYMDGGIPNGIGYETFLGDIENCSRSSNSQNELKVYEFRDCTNLNETLIRVQSKYDIEIGDIIKFDHLGAYSIVFQNHFHMWEQCRVDIVE